MITISNTEVVGWEHAIRGMRNPKNSWEKSDSGTCMGTLACHSCENNRTTECNATVKAGDFIVGPNDRKLMMTLRNAGTDHRKFMRMIVVYLDITAPLYWWKEFDTYKVGTVADSCSTMHKIHAKEFTLDDFSHEHLIDRPDFAAIDVDGETFLYSSKYFIKMTCKMLNYYRKLYLETKDKRYWWQMIQLLPSSYNQKRTVMLNYEVLANMYKSRKDHKLDEWHTLCDWMETLPYSELITGNATWSEWSEQDLYKIATYIQTNDPRITNSNSYVKVATNHNICDFVVDDKVLYAFDMAKVTVKDAIDFIRDFVDTTFERTLEFEA